MSSETERESFLTRPTGSSHAREAAPVKSSSLETPERCDSVPAQIAIIPKVRRDIIGNAA